MKVYIVEVFTTDEWYPCVDTWFDTEEDARTTSDRLNDQYPKQKHRVAKYTRDASPTTGDHDAT